MHINEYYTIFNCLSHKTNPSHPSAKRCKINSKTMKNVILSGFLALLLLFSSALPARAQASDQAESIHSMSIETLREQVFSATNQGDFATAELYWSELIERLPDHPALWSNRGNSRVSQNKLQEAIADYNKAIELAPEAPDPYLNRGTALEGLGRWQEAIADYNRVLDLDPNDPAAYNNRGNAKAGLGQWEEALEDYGKAANIVADYAFARANYALALYQTGQTDDAIRTMRNLVRKYPQFADMRAALTAALWEQGQTGEAESHWFATIGLDRRYQQLDWVKTVRRWPPSMVSALEKFLSLQ
jgi:tetratricopeptide (TPR) repeat protein